MREIVGKIDRWIYIYTSPDSSAIVTFDQVACLSCNFDVAGKSLDFGGGVLDVDVLDGLPFPTCDRTAVASALLIVVISKGKVYIYLLRSKCIP